MRSTIHKIAGVKNDKDFYKKYPTEAAFMKKHGKAFKKAQMGKSLRGEVQQTGGFTPFDFNASNLGTPEGAQVAAEGLGSGIAAVKEEKEALAKSKQGLGVSNIALQAARTTPEPIENEYVRPEDIQNTGEEFFPIYGVGSNPLAQDGARVPMKRYPNGGGGIPMYQAGVTKAAYQEEPEVVSGMDRNDFYRTSFWKGREKELDSLNEVYKPHMRDTTHLRGGKFLPRNFDNDSIGREYFRDATKNNSRIDLRLKNKQAGGNVPRAQWGAASQLAGNVMDNVVEPNAGGELGGNIGGTIGSMFGPAGKAIGEMGGKIIGQIADPNARKIAKNNAQIEQNTTNMAGMGYGAQLQQQYSANVQDGGSINAPLHKSGMLAQPSSMKHYRMFAKEGMNTLQDGGMKYGQGGDMGGDLQTLWGGKAEAMSYNPYLPGDGETVEFKGDMHNGSNVPGKSGIGAMYGGNPLEVEGGEPAMKLQDGGQVDQNGNPQENLTVFGNLKHAPSGKKFKNYVKDISKKEESVNKKIVKNVKGVEEFIPRTNFDKLKSNSFEANLKGGNMKLKMYADEKQDAAALQKAINDTAEEYGIVADDLSRGKYKVDKGVFKPSNSTAKDGITFPKAQDGKKFNSAKAAMAAGYKKIGNEWVHETKGTTGYVLTIPGSEADRIEPIVSEEIQIQGRANNVSYDQGYKNRAEEYEHDSFSEWKSKADAWHKANPGNTGSRESMSSIPRYEPQIDTSMFDRDPQELWIPPTPGSRDVATVRDPSKWLKAANSIVPFIRPSDQESLDPNQLYGEMFALSNNHVESVKAQAYRPQLDVPYDISLQDQMNNITSQSRAAQRMAGYNPAAQSFIAGQSMDAGNRVLGDQFRQNQAMKQQVYNQNRATMNDAQLKNLGIYDQQYVRQATAKSNTKEATQMALNSMSDKYAKNQLENRTLGIYENMYNYRYDHKGRARNMNEPAQFNTRGNFGANTANMTADEQYKAAETYMDEYKAAKKEEMKAAGKTNDYVGQNGISSLPLTRALKLYNN